MTVCLFCQKHDDPSGMKIYSACNISNGEPCKPCSEYVSLDAEIEQMQISLRNKLGRRHKLRKYINRQHNSMINRMPDEITTYIFELAASLDNQTAHSSVPLREGEKYAPLFLGSVCKAWRDVAWNMPQLWTFINIHIPTVEDLPARLDITKQWLSRTGKQHPLSIHLRTHETYNPDDVFTDEESDRLDQEVIDNFEPFVELLGLYSSRWQFLSANCPPRVIDLLCDNYQGAPILKTLQLSATRSPNFCFKLFQCGPNAAPGPTSIVLDGISPCLIALDWNRVTKMTIKHVSFEDVIDMLPGMPNLVNLTLSEMKGFFGNPIPSGVICPKIRSLSLKVSPREAAVFLVGFTLPVLEDLTIDLTGNTNVLRLVTLLIQRSSCTIASMSLSNIPDARPALLELIGCIGSLEHLAIRVQTQMQCYFLQALNDTSALVSSKKSNTPAVLPKFHRLVYILSPKDDIMPDFIATEILNPTWTVRFPQWKKLTILRDPNSAFLNNPDNAQYMIDHFRRTTRQRLLKLVDSGIEIFMPFKFTREAIVKSLDNSMTSTMNDIVALQSILSAFPN